MQVTRMREDSDGLLISQASQLNRGQSQEFPVLTFIYILFNNSLFKSSCIAVCVELKLALNC